MNSDITVEQFLQTPDRYVAIDVRSPGEFEDSAIPLAVNVPIFTNEERAEIGTIYKQESQQAAKWRAMEIVAPKLPELLGKIRDIEIQGKVPLLYCWRGGMRSRSITTFAHTSGLHVKRLEGGYRGFREYIMEQIPSLYPKQAIVLYGLTGTGKTEILHLLKERGYPTLDLEAYANHKGSVFGELDGRSHNQKTFDALLYQGLMEIKGSPYFIMEGESKRIGRAVQPPELLSLKENGIHLHIFSSLPKRIERIYKEYVKGREVDETFQEQIGHALALVQKRMTDEAILTALKVAWDQKDYATIIEVLMKEYYDPRYQNKNEEYIREEQLIHSDDIEAAVQSVIAFLKGKGLHSKKMVTKK